MRRQIPSSVTEPELRGMFVPYGSIVELALLKKNAAATCAFITYERWAQCEAAIEALSGKMQLEGAKMPMVVKFADAKVNEGGAMDMGMGMGMKRPFNDVGGPNKKQFNMGAGYNAYGMPGGGYDMSMMGYGPMGGMPMGGMMGMVSVCLGGGVCVGGAACHARVWDATTKAE